MKVRRIRSSKVKKDAQENKVIYSCCKKNKKLLFLGKMYLDAES